jgi:Copper type II ascorbate-dependent monooxygenase, C-terminal domain
MLLAVVTLTVACTKSWDYNPSEIPNDFAPLEKPAAGTGYQLHIPAFPIPAQFEREFFIRTEVGNSEEVFMNGYEVKQREGSHHVIAYQFEDESVLGLPKIGEMRDQNRPDGRANFFSNLANTNLFAEAASPYQKVDFPAGYAVALPANSTFDLNSHYFNKTDKTIYGEVSMNIYTTPKAEVRHLMQQGEVDNADVLDLPAGKTTTIKYTEILEEDRKLKILFSHMHKHGKDFKVYYVGGAKDGQLLYSADDWHNPNFVILTNDDYIQLKKGEGLRTEITYENNTNRNIKFGVTSEDEMGIFFYFFF